MKKQILLSYIFLIGFSHLFAQQPENTINSISFSCVPIINSVTVTETQNSINSVTSPSEDHLIICEKEGVEGEAEINIDVSAEELDESAIWQLENEFGEVFDNGEIINLPDDNPINFISDGNIFFLKVGIDKNGDFQLSEDDEDEILFTIRVTVITIKILNSAEERSFNPESNDASGIVEIKIDIGPNLSDVDGHLEWLQEQTLNNTPDLWDDHTGQIEFQSDFDNDSWLTEVGFGLFTEKNIRVKSPGKTKLIVKYVVGEVHCEATKELSVPQFVELRYNTTYSNEVYSIEQDFISVGLRNENIGNGNEQITDERNEIITDMILSFTEVRIEELYENKINLRFTENPPSFLENKIVLSNIAGSYPLQPIYGIAINILDAQCNNWSSVPLTAFELDEGNKISIGKLCVYPARFTTAGNFGDDWEAIFEEFHPDTGTPANNTHFDNDNNIINNDLLIAIETFGRLIGHTVAHETGHIIGLVPNGGHNSGDNNFLMDDGSTADFGERVHMSMLKPENRNLLLQILPAGEQLGYFD